MNVPSNVPSQRYRILSEQWAVTLRELSITSLVHSLAGQAWSLEPGDYLLLSVVVVVKNVNFLDLLSFYIPYYMCCLIPYLSVRHDKRGLGV